MSIYTSLAILHTVCATSQSISLFLCCW